MKMPLYPVFLLVAFYTSPTYSWSGILLNSKTSTQLYFPTTSPHVVGNVNYGLPSQSQQVATLLNGRVYVTGGYSDSGGYSNDLTIFNPATNTSTKGASMAVKRRAHAAGVINGKLVVAGGDTDNADYR
jgi:N-acetylneuraminic acid mutarotase